METETKYDYLIIGGGVAGTSAAETIRQNDAKGSIAIVSDEPYRFYSRLMLSKPNFFLGKIPFDSVWLKKEAWYSENRIALLTGRTAAALKPADKTVSLDNGQILHYGKLLLALGAFPNRWQVPGADKLGVLYLRNLEDGKKIIAAIKSAKSAVLIGSGFTSFEMCEMLRLANIEVTLVMLEPYYWYPLLDEPSGRLIESALEKHGVKILRQAEIKEVVGDERVEGVTLKDAAEIDCDIIIPGIGVRPPIEWLASSGVKLNRGIIADEYLKTSLPEVWTAGDCAEFKDLILEEQIMLGNWVNAQNQGRAAAYNMIGQNKPFRLVSFYTAQGFGITIAFAGDVKPTKDRQIITRGEAESGSYGRLLIDEHGELVGATLINRTPELSAITKIIEKNLKVADKSKELTDPKFDLKKLLSSPSPDEGRVAEGQERLEKNNNLSAPTGHLSSTGEKKIRIGWFSFSCCEDNTIVFTELMNDHWQEWKDKFDFRHARVLKSKNVMDEMDIAFIEGAIASEEQIKKLKTIREKSKKLVAVGACAVIGMPSGQRNQFSSDQNKEIEFLLARFRALPKVLKVADVVKVDASIPGCPMDPKVFLSAVDTLVKEFKP